jgi:hypothetical protein
MIVARIFSGLGNQMFQYAAGLALAERHRSVLKLDVNWFQVYPDFEAHNRYGLSCFNICEQFATQPEIDRLRGLPLSLPERMAVRIARPLRFFQLAASHSQQGSYFAEQGSTPNAGFGALQDATYLDGLWQSDEYFRGIAPILRQHLTIRYPMPPAVAALARRIAASQPNAFIHFRRGDYVRDARISREIGTIGLSYYIEAERRLREAYPGITCYIFSDDIEGIAREYRPQTPHEFVRCIEPSHSHEIIRLMGLCQHAVISNSTFSWWGAWLIDSTSKTVFAPEPWFADPPTPNPGPVPPSWIKLRRS